MKYYVWFENQESNDKTKSHVPPMPTLERDEEAVKKGKG